MSSFFGNGIDPSTSSSINTEIQIYLSISQIPKYDSKDPCYEKCNPL
ncbi:9674_t:CDS:1, partial [Cetraspora pellucida]